MAEGGGGNGLAFGAFAGGVIVAELDEDVVNTGTYVIAHRLPDGRGSVAALADGSRKH